MYFLNAEPKRVIATSCSGVWVSFLFIYRFLTGDRFCLRRGRFRGRVQGVRTPPPPPEMTCGFLIQLVFCKKKKKKTMWFIGVEVEQETSAPPPKKNPGPAPATTQAKSSSRYLRRLMRARWNERSETKRLSTNLHVFLLSHDIIARSMTSNCALDLSTQLTIFKVTASIRTPGWLVRTLTKVLSPFWEERWSGVKPYWQKMKESIKTIFPIMCKDKNVIKRITITQLYLDRLTE